MKSRHALLAPLLVAACSGSATTTEPAAPAPPSEAPRPPADPAAIRGTVVDAAGKPVAGALVAAIDQNATAPGPIAHAVSDERGAFRIAVPPGTYGASATAEGKSGGFHCDIEVDGKAAPPPVTVELGDGGTTIAGRASRADGAPLAGVSLEVGRFSDERCDGFLAVTDDDGRYRLTLPAGPGYVAYLADEDWESDFARSPHPGDADLDLVGYPRPAPGPAPAAVIDWIKEHAVRLDGVEAGHGFDDMEPLRQVVGDARIVALGEATHGTREFFQLKHRMLEFLVEKMGFTAFAIEATMPEAFDVDDYVVNGRGDPRAALDGLYFWTWNTEEVLALIEWMRAYNADPAHRRKIHFYGFDMQMSSRAARVALDYLARVDPKAARRLGPALGPLRDEFLSGRFAKLDAKQKDAAKDAAGELLRLLDAEHASYAKKTGEAAWSLARQHARVLVQFTDLNGAEEGLAVRDRSMAENVGWILDREGPRGKLVLWAHNGHVSTGGYSGIASMGQHLRKRYGDAMRVFGFAFNRGSFRAIDVGESSRGLREFTVPAAPEGSLDRALSRAGSLYALDLRAVPEDGPVADWFGARRGARSVGAVFAEASIGRPLPRRTVLHDYDAVLFVGETTASRPNHSPSSAEGPVQQPTNLSFEDGLAGWTGDPQLASHGYRADVVSRGAAEGSRSVRVRRRRGRRYAALPGELSQTIRAASWAGKKVRITLAARAGGDRRDGVYVFAAARGGRFGSGAAMPRDYRRVEGRRWRRYQLELEVPAGPAPTLRLGLAVTGDAVGWLDAVSIEPAP